MTDAQLMKQEACLIIDSMLREQEESFSSIMGGNKNKAVLDKNAVDKIVKHAKRCIEAEILAELLEQSYWSYDSKRKGENMSDQEAFCSEVCELLKLFNVIRK